MWQFDIRIEFDKTKNHTKGEPWNSLMKATASTYKQVPKTTASASPLPPPLNMLLRKYTEIYKY